jgi:hypothetical protein
MSFIIPGRLLLLGLVAIIFQVTLLMFPNSLSPIEKVIFVLGIGMTTLSPFFFLHISGMVRAKSEELLIQLRGLRCFQTRKDVSRRLRSLRPYGVRISPIRAVGYVALNVYYSSMISVVVTVVSAIKLAE